MGTHHFERRTDGCPVSVSLNLSGFLMPPILQVERCLIFWVHFPVGWQYDPRELFRVEGRMKRKPICFCFVLIIAAVTLAGVAPVKGELDATASQNRLITVMNPAITEKLAERVPLAARLDTLQGKTIYIVDMNYEGMGRTPVLEEMRRWFAKNMPTVKTVLKLKSGSYISDDPGLWKEIAANRGNGVIIGVAG